MKMKMKQLPLSVVQTLGLSVALGIVLPAYAQAPVAPTQKVDRIEVTGSNIKRIDGEAAVPVVIVSKEDIAKTGVTSASELLDKLNLNSGATYSLAQGVGDSGQPGFSGASLRGLGPNNTLILLNGRRVANYAFNGGAVDVNSIPLAAIERVEILKDGASAIYGTDAIGGVINFILRKDYQGAEVSYYGSNTDRGGGKVDKYTVTAGYGDLSTQRFNVLFSFDREESERLRAKQREFAKTAIRPDLGIQQTSGNAYPANIRGNYLLNGVMMSGAIGNTAAASGCVPDSGSFYLPDVNLVNCRYDFTSVLDIFPPIDRDSFVVRTVGQLTNNTQVFAEYTLVKNKIRYASSETPINDFTGINGPIFYPAGGKYYPGAFRRPDGSVVTPVGPLAIAWRGKDTGLRTNEAKSEAERTVIGVEGALAGWDYKAGATYASSEARDTYVDGWLSEQRLRAAIATGNVNVFSTTGQDAAGQALLDAAKILQDVRRSKGSTAIVDAKASGELLQLPAGPLSAAFGVERRKEKLNDRPDVILSSGDILGGGGSLPSATGSRTVTAGFAEFSIPLTKTLEAGVALRYDRYSDFGNTTNPKISFRWTPVKEVLVRGSYNTGFRAPTLPDILLPRYNSNTADTHNDPIRCPKGNPIGNFVDDGLECEAQFPNILGGGVNLQPEKSKQGTLGVVLEPAKGISLSIDGWFIERRNSIQALGDNTLFGSFTKFDAAGKFIRFPRLANGLCSNDLPSAPTPANVPCAIQSVVQVTENLGKYRTQGIDIGGVWGLGTPYGKFKTSIDATIVTKYEYQRDKTAPFTDNLGKFTSDNGAVSRYRHVLNVNWSWGAFDATLSQNFVLGYQDDLAEQDDGTNRKPLRRVGNVETYDFQGSWTIFKGLQLVAGVRNLLDRDPPASGQGQTFQVGYDPRYGDARGRNYYGRITYSFK
ncbi:MAG: TonB-dependent receptor [Betaproteobacteria bacterium]|nr:TonB-dependent receptor [Betaproteobacteria bacterium]